ncbi:MAG: tetratricopeptide repeat protein, partial [Betaproteobacteria bacterium]|nr:tetratricopeptide repeat protein [Betaproteobacteria bacterium]
AVNALYWAGMDQLSLKDFKGARASNEKLFKEYPDSSKAPDALLNLASAWTGLGDAANAKATLKLLVSKYPDSPAAGKAKARLKQH